ncbi:[citrate [pro-3S]-lyase] ligase [Alkalithermobacter paradoxus]|uniref:[Citrate [pro-3S]-lyase] ligase n=1 Tax=Alkalithermobacter paradoxus TaxID=29349 RepID=A0A1V4I8X9_9FIRM|nr:[citrate [pro-3S]-lyase] ligase [[Clostridium] thermoalcaliphilum]
MEFLNLRECIIENNDIIQRRLINKFLVDQGLKVEDNVEYTFALLNEESVVATGSLDGKVIKYVAVDESYQGIGIANKIVSNLINEAHRKGTQHLFVYTNPKNLNIFLDLGFYEIAQVPGMVVLLENQNRGIDNFMKEISSSRKDGLKISAIVVNCNPFTLGHQYLIEKAAEESDILHIFVVSEDKSDFPTEIRLRLVKEGTKHLENVVVHQTKNYLISSATFPSYFMKRYDDIVKTHALLDIEIFARYFVPALGINHRYVGEEPFCQLTSTYNDTMKIVLPKYGIKVVEVPRMKEGTEVISASRVRKLLREGKLIDTKKLLPITTYQFLTSQEGQKIIEKIK